MRPVGGQKANVGGKFVEHTRFRLGSNGRFRHNHQLLALQLVVFWPFSQLLPKFPRHFAKCHSVLAARGTGLFTTTHVDMPLRIFGGQGTLS